MRVILSEVKFQITEDIIQEILDIARDAGTSIMEVYKTDFEIEFKDDRSPVTKADKEANSLIIERLIKDQHYKLTEKSIKNYLSIESYTNVRNRIDKKWNWCSGKQCG